MHHTKCRILIVDDYQPIRETMRSLLTLHDDIQVIGEAADGNEAIQMVTACRPDVILMDLNMPKRNSIDAAQEIKKAWKEAVIIGVCAVRDEYIIDTFLKAGAEAVISKDSFVQHLYPTIQEAWIRSYPCLTSLIFQLDVAHKTLRGITSMVG